ncbi:MAG: retron St85 family RNA-directed DNA polymerase [Planctomycetota bacterium]|nr:retron St85 family RNA-directed DNA polymerase [Planctomycetota bacterium]
MSSIAQHVARYLGWSLDETEHTAQRAPRSYRRYLVPKKSGGVREIFHPAKKTKAIQYAMIDLYLSRLPVHDAATAYRRDVQSPLRRNAALHARYRYTVRVDMRAFFPSIKPADLWDRLVASGAVATDGTATKDHDFVANALFIRQGVRGMFLSIGAPSSPAISNAVMYSLDQTFTGFAAGHGGRYTRYADDLVYSTNRQGECADFVNTVRAALDDCGSPQLTLNESKTCYTSRKGRRIVTGLVLTPTGQVSIGRKKKRYIRKLVFDLGRGKLDKTRRAYLRGFLAFVLDVEPAFYNRLAHKYGGELLREALLGTGD